MKFRKNTIMAITFDDHCEDHSEPLRFTVYGLISKVTREYVCIDSWHYTSGLLPCDDPNVKRFTIMRKVIVKAKRLEVVG